MEEKRKPGRPKVDAGFIEKEKRTHRAAVNYKYAMDGADLIDRHADKIPDGKLLWFIYQMFGAHKMMLLVYPLLSLAERLSDFRESWFGLRG